MFTRSTLRYNIAKPLKYNVYYMLFWAEGDLSRKVQDVERVIVIRSKLGKKGKGIDGTCFDMKFEVDKRYGMCFKSFAEFKKVILKID